MEKLKIQSYPSIREQVYKYIRKMILNGEIGPGERLIEASRMIFTGGRQYKT
jgi:DNA-binding GntR family transcriptional regulator